MKTKIKKGDTVLVTTGKEKGKTGPVIRVFGDTQRVAVEGVNLYKKFVRSQATRQSQAASTQVELPRAMHLSNVMLVCPNCKKPTRVAYEGTGENKVRVCKKCGKNL